MAISPYIKHLREKIGNEMLLLPSIGAIILDERGWVLLQRASDDGKWYTIGGAIEPGEEPAETLVREVKEETGLDVIPDRVVAVQSSPLVTYPNGHEVIYVSITFLCRVVGGRLQVNDDESLELRYFPPDGLPELRQDHLDRIRHALSRREEAMFHSARP
jgi:8-oxo-dGTP pyrophosphatase MutT (NUDIX family)